MSLIKIADAPQPCWHPEHNPPNMIVLEPGTYLHTCPSCGQKTTIIVPLITCNNPLTTSGTTYTYDPTTTSKKVPFTYTASNS